MQPFPPLHVQVKVRPWHCILDGALLLAPQGLLFALRLAEEMSVWLGPSLWNLLDNTDTYLANTSRLTRDLVRQDNNLLRILTQWQAVRLDADIARLGMYWAGDATHESFLPEDVDKSMPWRFEQLAASLDQRSGNPTMDFGSFSHESKRDAVALCGALVRRHPIIFTLFDKAQEPAICAFLRQCDIPCTPVPAADAMLQQHLAPIFARTGVLELGWSGLRLAAVHVVAPHTVGLIAAPAKDDPLDELHTQPSPANDAWWEDARAFWYPLC